MAEDARRLFIPKIYEIVPFAVLLFHQCDLSCSEPTFQLLLALDSIVGITKCLAIYEASQIVFAAKSPPQFLSVLVHPTNEIVCHSYVQHTVLLVRDNVNIPLEISFHRVPRYTLFCLISRCCQDIGRDTKDLNFKTQRHSERSEESANLSQILRPNQEHRDSE